MSRSITSANKPPFGFIEAIPILRYSAGEPIFGASFMMPIEKAHGIVDDKDGYWKGNKVLYLLPDKNLKVTWKPMQSGYAGPLVMQVVT